MDNIIINLRKHNYIKSENIWFASGLYGELACPDINNECIEKKLTELTGSFFIVVNLNDRIALATDRMGSMPLFYSYHNEQLYVSDDIAWIKKEIDAKVDYDKLDEYRNCSFVLGDSTLLKNIHRVPTGEVVYISRDGRGTSTNYFSYRSSNTAVRNYTYQMFKEDVHTIAQRLAVSCIDKKVVIPLSTGADSLLISSIVKMAGINNVLCYTYGKIDAKEKNGSRYIAESMSFDWRFIEYTTEKWKRFRDSGTYEQYMAYAGNYSNCIHIQDAIAVEEILNDFSPADRLQYVFLPGHTGVIGGGNVKSDIFYTDKYDFNDRIKIYGSKDFNLWGKGKSKVKKSHKLMEQLNRPVSSKEEEISFFQKFDMQERQTKAIVCSLSVYEFAGAIWALPLNDATLMEHLYGMQISDRIDKSQYKEFCRRLFEELSGKEGLTVRKKNLSSLYSILRKVVLPIYMQFDRIRRVWTHDLNWFELLKPKEKRKYILGGGQHITAITSDLYIDFILGEA